MSNVNRSVSQHQRESGVNHVLLTILSYTPDTKGHRIGFFDAAFKLPGGGTLIVRRCAIHEINGKRWATFPAYPAKVVNKSEFRPVLEFSDEKTQRAYRAAVIAALEPLIPSAAKGPSERAA